MKKIIIAISALAVLLMSSCTKEFVTVKHNSSEPQSEYYIDESRMFEGLVAAYDPLKWYDYFYQYTPLHLMSDIMADDIYCGGSNDGDQPQLVKIHYYTQTPTEIVDVPWTTSYSGINRCCHVLENVDNVPGMSDETKALYKAEATVLKAYYYTILWKFYGNVPYYDVNLVSPYVAPQLTADEVYTNIVTRLEEVFEMNVLPMRQTPENYGRVTKAMAYMLYTEAVMYQNDESRYGKALGFMKEIIESGQYALVADFESIWAETGEWGTESIWEINYVSEGGVRDWGAPIATGGNVFSIFMGVPQGTSVTAEGWGFGPVAQHAYDMYEEGDIRRDGGIYNHNEWLEKVANDDQRAAYAPRWQSVGLHNKKYMARANGNHGKLADANMNHGNNIRVYRYAETLLNAAELSVLLGQNGSSWLEEVRRRAGCTDKGSDQAAIIKERRKEFLGEGKRYWDLVRSGQAASVLAAGTHEYRTAGWSENKKHWPIPQAEIDKTASSSHPIKQNNY